MSGVKWCHLSSLCLYGLLWELIATFLQALLMCPSGTPSRINSSHTCPGMHTTALYIVSQERECVLLKSYWSDTPPPNMVRGNGVKEGTEICASPLKGVRENGVKTLSNFPDCSWDWKHRSQRIKGI
jgi:hypothetical protein